MIGSLDQRITFQRETRTPDGGGGYSVDWAPLVTDPTVWAEVFPGGGGEGERDGAVNATALYVFQIRNRTDLSELDRIIWNGEPYNIRRIARRGGREMYLTIEAERGVAQ